MRGLGAVRIALEQWYDKFSIVSGHRGVNVMDYEFRIQLLEKETAHLREIQRLLGEHQDITDQRLEKLQSVTTALVDSTVELRNVANQTSVDVAKMARKVDDLIEGLLREPRNGKGPV